MRELNRIPHTLRLLGAAWMANPDMRLTQLVSSAASLGGYTGGTRECICGKDSIVCADPYHVEDDKVMAGLVQLAAGEVKGR